MKKTLIFLLIVGVLSLGAISISEGICGESTQDGTVFLDDGSFSYSIDEGSTPDGGGQGGGGAGQPG